MLTDTLICHEATQLNNLDKRTLLLRLREGQAELNACNKDRSFKTRGPGATLLAPREQSGRLVAQELLRLRAWIKDLQEEVRFSTNRRLSIEWQVSGWQ